MLTYASASQKSKSRQAILPFAGIRSTSGEGTRSFEKHDVFVRAFCNNTQTQWMMNSKIALPRCKKIASRFLELYLIISIDLICMVSVAHDLI